MSGAQNFPVGNNDHPWELPEIKGTPREPDVPNDWKKLRNSPAYPQIEQQLEVRKEYWRHYLPGGKLIREFALKDPETAGIWAALASQIIDEIEFMEYIVDSSIREQASAQTPLVPQNRPRPQDNLPPNGPR